MSSNYQEAKDKSPEEQESQEESKAVDQKGVESVSAEGDEDESAFEAGEAAHPRLLSVVPVDIDQLLAEFEAEE